MIGEKQSQAHTDIVVMTTGVDNSVSGGAQSFKSTMESSVVNEKRSISCRKRGHLEGVSQSSEVKHWKKM